MKYSTAAAARVHNINYGRATIVAAFCAVNRTQICWVMPGNRKTYSRDVAQTWAMRLDAVMKANENCAQARERFIKEKQFMRSGYYGSIKA